MRRWLKMDEGEENFGHPEPKNIGCKFYYTGDCEHGLTSECPMYDDNWKECVDAENRD